jgi:hypothetical protein
MKSFNSLGDGVKHGLVKGVKDGIASKVSTSGVDSTTAVSETSIF